MAPLSGSVKAALVDELTLKSLTVPVRATAPWKLNTFSAVEKPLCGHTWQDSVTNWSHDLVCFNCNVNML